MPKTGTLLSVQESDESDESDDASSDESDDSSDESDAIDDVTGRRQRWRRVRHCCQAGSDFASSLQLPRDGLALMMAREQCDVSGDVYEDAHVDDDDDSDESVEEMDDSDEESVEDDDSPIGRGCAELYTKCCVK